MYTHQFHYPHIKLIYIIPQFHWNDYSDKGYLTALSHLCDLKMEGVISAIGLCNFDTIRTDEICTQLGPGAIVSNQVQVHFYLLHIYSIDLLSQFSIIDTRPLHGMADVCERHGLKLLTYGTLVSCPWFSAISLINIMTPVRWLFGGQVAGSSGTRFIFRQSHALAEEGAHCDSSTSLTLIYFFSNA